MINRKQKAGRPKGSSKKFPTTRNGKRTKAYEKYVAMKARCLNPGNHNYKYYGGRGVIICERWLGREGFVNFVSDMGEPLPGFTLGRIDNDKGYSPDNCAWQTPKEQNSNRRPGGPRNKDSIRQKAMGARLPYMVVYRRIKLFGWSESRALATPVGKPGRPFAAASGYGIIRIKTPS